MHFPQQILNVLEIFSPALILLRQEVFYDVTEPLDADAQLMQGDFTAVSQGSGV